MRRMMPRPRCWGEETERHSKERLETETTTLPTLSLYNKHNIWNYQNVKVYPNRSNKCLSSMLHHITNYNKESLSASLRIHSFVTQYHRLDSAWQFTCNALTLAWLVGTGFVTYNMQRTSHIQWKSCYDGNINLYLVLISRHCWQLLHSIVLPPPVIVKPSVQYDQQL